MRSARAGESLFAGSAMPKVFRVIGAMGGPRTISGMSVKDAVESDRIPHQWPPGARRTLATPGHKFTTDPAGARGSASAAKGAAAGVPAGTSRAPALLMLHHNPGDLHDDDGSIP